ncbi:glycerophosphodiester phosphodiesterase family protein [Dictyocaulus viviparus]|uniref:Glycerophosphodiester phosphodiesterase family protein n=1 Tax=Dictyocaulus viviparus TaxID=29172 RepID=A0A0D8XJR2_DICVI|nr:glycerophosphodiester phosphodiesterase family protein [Dictyocaulus viviparus]
MHGYILFWHILTITYLAAAISNSRHVSNIIVFTPYIITICFYIFRNKSVTNPSKAKFFDGIKMGGHRGSPHEAPENSIEGFKKARSSKCELVEFDVHLTSDGVPVLIHDETTARTSSEDLTVSEVTSSDLKNIPLNAVNGVEGQIPTLYEAVDWCKKNNMKMIIDVKKGDRKLIEALTMTIRKRNLYDKAIISSFDPFVPFRVKKIDENILTGFTSRSGHLSHEEDHRRLIRGYSKLWLTIYLIIDDLIDLGIRTFALPNFLGVDLLLLHHKNVNSYLVEDALRNQIHVFTWTVNDPKEARFLRSINVPFLTDVPQLMQETNK